MDRSAVERVRAEGGLLAAAEVLLVIEIVSPGSRRTDGVIKRAEYADAGIPHCWIVDLEPADAVSLRVEDVVAVNTYATELPYPVAIDLARIGGLLA